MTDLISHLTLRATVEDGADVLHEVFPQAPGRSDATAWTSFASMSEYCQTAPDSTLIEAADATGVEAAALLCGGTILAQFFRGYSAEARSGLPGFSVEFSRDPTSQLLARQLADLATSKGMTVRTTAPFRKVHSNSTRPAKLPKPRRHTPPVTPTVPSVQPEPTLPAPVLDFSKLDLMIESLEKELTALKAIREVRGNAELVAKLVGYLQQ